MLKAWIEAMRLRTLPVSTAGVLMGVALAAHAGAQRTWVTIGCLAFAIMAQIASNFANEYYDFKAGLDLKGRQGPRRGVTEGDIKPAQMRMVALCVILSAAWIGCLMVWTYGTWWMFLAGVVVVLGAYSYSTGPYPLAAKGWGEVAVIFFFGVVPVCLTYLLEGAQWNNNVMWMSIAMGLMGANVLIVNNYRDRDDDAQVGKKTLAVRLGRGIISGVYLINGFIAMALGWSCWAFAPTARWWVVSVYLVLHVTLYFLLCHRQGKALNPLLGLTSLLMLAYAVAYLVIK